MSIAARLNPGEAFGSRVLKVNHAGEHGAVNIYRAQALLAKLTAPSMVAELREFQSHEERHRAIFGGELQRRAVRRCKSYWLCGAGGLALGIFTGLCGAKAIAATTVAIERVVLAHMREQIVVLQRQDSYATSVINSVVEEEQLHHDQSNSHIRAGAFWPRILTPVVSLSTEAVIWAGMHL